MSPLDIGLQLGVTLEVVDEPEAATPPTQTDTAFLIHSVSGSGAPANEVTQVRSSGEARNLYPNDPALTTITDTFFQIGGGRMFISPLKGPDNVEARASFIERPQDLRSTIGLDGVIGLRAR